MKQLSLIVLPALALAACDSQAPRQSQPVKTIQVRSAEQEQLHQLNEMNRAIALKRAILASGYRCRRVESSGFVGPYKNLDMWTATCSEGRQWAVFAGPDGSAQVRDCVDVARHGLPECKVAEQPGQAPAAN